MLCMWEVASDWEVRKPATIEEMTERNGVFVINHKSTDCMSASALSIRFPAALQPRAF